jgi:hypothetical protein
VTLEEFRDRFAGQAQHEARYRLSPHAKERAAELGFNQAEIDKCVQSPEQSYPSHASYGPDRRTYQRGALAVVLALGTQDVVTVLLRTPRTWVHGVDDRMSA